MKKFSILLLSIPMFIGGVANAAGQYDNPVIRAQTQNQYSVSAVLRKNSEPGTIKLVQSIVEANSSAEASGKVFGAIRVDFPDFAVMDSLVNQIENKSNNCETWL